MKETALEKLKMQYTGIFGGSADDRLLRRRQYLSVKRFCLDIELLSLNDIGIMESEVNNSF